MKIRILTSLPVEPWVRNAAEEFNAAGKTVDGVPIEVDVVAMDGLTALGRWDRNEFGALPADVRPEDLTQAEQDQPGDLPHRLDSRTAATWSSWPTPPTKSAWAAMSS